MARNVQFDIRAVDKTAQAFRSVKQRVGSLTKSVFSLRNALAGAAGAMAFQSLATGADNLLKFSNRVGVSVEALSELKYVAEISGLSIETFTMAMQRSTRRIAEAAQGTGEAQNALKELGLDASKLVKLSPDRQLEAIADAMLGVTNQADKVRLAMKLFDSEGVAMIQTMQGGSKEILALRKEAEALGGTLSKSQAEDFAEYNDGLVRLKTSFGDLGKALSTVLLKPINYVIDAFASFFSMLARVIRSAADLLGLTENQAKAFDELAKTANQTTLIITEGTEGAALAATKLVVEYDKVKDRMDDITVTGRRMSKVFDDTIKTSIQGVEDGLVSLITQTDSVKDAFKNMARSIVADLARAGIRKYITGALTQYFFPTATLPQATPATEGSFAGGGYTGRGARVGGIDGKGGFPAILHPNETVVDHSMGQGVGSSVNVVYNISAGVAQTVRTEIMSMLPQITEATKAAVVDAKRRGGSFSKVMS
jgi:hypothetical protein